LFLWGCKMLFSQRRPHGIYYIQYLAYKNRKIFSSCHFSAFPRIIFIVFHRVSLFVCHCCCHCLHCLFANLFMCMYMPFIHVQSHPHSHINSCFFFCFFNLYVPIRLSWILLYGKSVFFYFISGLPFCLAEQRKWRRRIPPLFNIQYALSGEMEKLCILNDESKAEEACAKVPCSRDVALKNNLNSCCPQIFSCLFICPDDWHIKKKVWFYCDILLVWWAMLRCLRVQFISLTTAKKYYLRAIYVRIE